MRFPLVGVFAALILPLLCPAGLAADAEIPERPLTLDDCVSLAFQYSPLLVIARQDVASGEADLKRVLSSYYPSAAFVATQGRTGGSSFLETAAGTIPFTISTTRRESEVLLSQTIWETGRKESVGQARRSLEASRAGEQTAVQDLILSVSQLYYAALAAEQLVEVAEATLAAARDHEKLVKARAAVGEGAPIDVVPAEADVAEAEFSMLQAENSAGLAKARLKSEMGVPPVYRLRVAQPRWEEYEEPLPSLERALQLSLENRPEIIALRKSVAAGRERLRLAEAVEGATIRFSAEYDRGITGPKEGIAWAAIVSATAFLFDGGGRKANVDAARASLRSLQAQEQQTVNGIGLEVERAILDVQTARKSVEAAEKAVASAEAQLAAAEGKYREGIGIFVEILDAQETVARARTNRVQATYDYQTALVALRKALGVLEPPAGPGERP